MGLRVPLLHIPLHALRDPANAKGSAVAEGDVVGIAGAGEEQVVVHNGHKASYVQREVQLLWKGKKGSCACTCVYVGMYVNGREAICARVVLRLGGCFR